MEKDNAAKEERFSKEADRIRKLFSEMPFGMLLVVQGLLIEAADQAMKKEKKGMN